MSVHFELQCVLGFPDALTYGDRRFRQAIRAAAAHLGTFLPRYTPFVQSGSGPQLMHLHSGHTKQATVVHVQQMLAVCIALQTASLEIGCAMLCSAAQRFRATYAAYW